MPNYYPPVGFHFKVEVLGLSANDNDVRFSEVSGLAVEMGTEEITEGGENRFIQKFPTRAKYPDLVLKRGLMLNSKLITWIRECIEDYNIRPKNIDINLLNEKHEPLLTWHVINAYPTKWAVSDFNASNNAVVIETLQFFYQYFTLDKS
ncbi:MULTISPECIES: phage tail protein [Nostoc]|uniref:Phage tail protein n=2 Tax=Nostoc TaxID=1177 RepID=A0ABR8IHY9_9NOSO|nr:MULTISPECIES: phage tail protein [Nostoc]MBD2563971.1 phage tail protein [Nostoc linckia FACHB-391]MBD2650441.1 phage tail protein [Nostoc foliaceum FACHB-393]